jgi:uncharacterized alpha-E superfamily protein
MAQLLARTADRLYWGARYVERAEDTSRIVRAYNDLVVDYPSAELLRWEPLTALTGSDTSIDVPATDPAGEATVVRYLLADRTNPSSIVSTVGFARENLRTTREVMPREAWQAVNQLSQYVEATAAGAVERQLRDQFLGRVVQFSRRLDGILESTMTRSNEFRLLRLGRLVERADMTTRVVGVAAASILGLEAAHRDELVTDQVRWMSVLRSVSALQMYQRAVRGPIEGLSVVRFLLAYAAFPRSVQGCLDDIRSVLLGLPGPGAVLAVLDEIEISLHGSHPDAHAGLELDRAMETMQAGIARLDVAIRDRYVASVL